MKSYYPSIFTHELKHYGIKGMKWGVRRTPEQLKYDRYSIAAHLHTRLKRIVTPNKVVIRGIKDHALDRIENREDRRVSAKQIIDALSNPLLITKEKVDSEGRKSVQYIGRAGTVVVNPENGLIVTVWKTSSKKAAKLTRKNR